MSGPVLSAHGVSKAFGPVQVLFGVDFDVRAGEVHALVGENGAGKSTLMKILGGYLPATAGTVAVDGREAPAAGPGDREALGVVLIHQEFNLADHLSVEENVFLGRELRRGPFLDRAAMQARARSVLEGLECPVDPRVRVRDLSVSEKQMVERAKAVSREVRVLIMDEPTAVLTPAEAAVLFRLIRRLTAQGVGIVYISHKLAEVTALADRITVLRDGRRVACEPAAALAQDDIARLMVGRSVADLYPARQPPPDDAPAVLEVAVLFHGTLVAVYQGNGMWPMFFFGFAGIFVITQMHGLPLARWMKWLVFGAYLVGAIAIYNMRGWNKAYELISIPLIEYAGVFVLALLFGLGLRLFGRRAPSETAA